VGYNKLHPISSPRDALYFSVVTITTLGYGDIHPVTGTGRWLSLIQTLMGFILVVLVFGTFLTGVRNIHNLKKVPYDREREK